MKEIYVVTSGEYSDYGIVKIFENIEDAEQFCAIYNDNMKPAFDIFRKALKELEIYEQREIVEKIIRDEFYKCKAEKEGI